MVSVQENRVAGLLMEEASTIRKSWGWILAFSVIQIIVGMLAISFAFIATLASVVMLGILFLAAAAVQLAAAIWVRGWRGTLLFILLSVLYGVASFMTLQHPLLAAEGFTLMLAALFLVAGTFRIVASLMEREAGWGWILANGIVTFLLGILIWQQWPESGLWAIGLLVGIDLVVNGATWFALAIAMRSGLSRISTPAATGIV